MPSSNRCGGRTQDTVGDRGRSGSHLVRRTLGRLSRRLGIPVWQLSAAVNRVTRGNVSRYVNRFRIERACERLLAGESVAVAMESSGFSTRSNFSREFRRITGKSPSDWRGAETRG